MSIKGRYRYEHITFLYFFIAIPVLLIGYTTPPSEAFRSGGVLYRVIRVGPVGLEIGAVANDRVDRAVAHPRGN
jgi:hypothetical protein